MNLWVHRPLAFAFVALIYRTRITPNQITLLAVLVGCAAGVCIFIGSPPLMVLGGALIWTSAILDGADGILARAKRLFSDVGRSLDGMCDFVVMLATVPAAFYHLWHQQHSALHMGLIAPSVLSAMLHVYLYDYYKEAYLQHTRLDWSGRAETPEDIARRLEQLRREGAPWIARLATKLHVDLLGNQIRAVRLTNPAAIRQGLQHSVSDASVRIYRRHNAGPMQLWAAISLAPHSYAISICAMFDRLDVYLWLRVGLANVIFLVAAVWQRRATRRTAADLAAAGLAPQPLQSPA